jgi:hypothetical protein
MYARSSRLLVVLNSLHSLELSEQLVTIDRSDGKTSNSEIIQSSHNPVLTVPGLIPSLDRGVAKNIVDVVHLVNGNHAHSNHSHKGAGLARSDSLRLLEHVSIGGASDFVCNTRRHFVVGVHEDEGPVFVARKLWVTVLSDNDKFVDGHDARFRGIERSGLENLGVLTCL